MYDHLVGDSIRLIEVTGTCLAGDNDTAFRDLAIQCHVHTIPLAEALSKRYRYAALSYVWGSGKLRRPIVCDGKEMLVTAGLHDALWKFGSTKQVPRLLWIDAISINQNDMAEKAREVDRMDLIYRNASIVLVWLGTSAGIAGQAFERYWKYLQDDQGIAMQADVEAREKGVQFMSSHDWFQRVWTLQEIVLARKAELHCGPYAITWDKFLNASAFFARFPALDQINTLRSDASAKRNTRLSDLVRHSASRQATNNRDRIYGLRGLFIGDWPIKIDYEQKEVKVLADATLVIVKEQRNLHFLNLIRLRQIDLVPPRRTQKSGKAEPEANDTDGTDTDAPKSGFLARALKTFRGRDKAPKTFGATQPLVAYIPDGKREATKQGISGTVVRDFRPHMHALSWIPSWSAPFPKDRERMQNVLPAKDLVPRPQIYSHWLHTLEKDVNFDVSLDGTVLQVRGRVIGRIEPPRPVLLKEHSWEGQIVYRPLPRCLFEGLWKGRQQAYPAESYEVASRALFDFISLHDAGNCSCLPNFGHQAKRQASGWAWVCSLYNALDLVVLEPVYDELSGKLRFALLLKASRRTTEQIARSICKRRAKIVSAQNDVDPQVQHDFAYIPTHFDLIGELENGFESAFWKRCPNKLPGPMQMGEGAVVEPNGTDSEDNSS